MKTGLAITTSFLFATFASAQAQPPWPPPRTDAAWSAYWATSPTAVFADGPAHGDVTPHGDIWTAATEFPYGRLALWDQFGWQKQTGYLESSTGSAAITAIEADAAGNVYVTGIFDLGVNPDGSTVALSNVACWDSSAQEWRSLGQGANGNAYAVDVDAAGRVAIGGIFSQVVDANGVPVPSPNGAIWDPSIGPNGGWTPLGFGLDGGIFEIEFAPNGDLMFTGSFRNGTNPNATPVALDGVGRWDGSGFFAFGQGITSSGFPPDLAIDAAGDLYLAGDGLTVTNSNGTPVISNAVHWDGTSWSALAGVPAQFLSGIEASGNTLYVMGQQAFEIKIFHHVAGTWTVVGKPLGEIAYVIDGEPAYAATRLYAGGLFFNILHPPSGVVYPAVTNTYWDGVAWRELRSAGTSGVVNTIGGAFGHAIAGGNFTYLAGNRMNNVAKFDGTRWSSLGQGTNGEVHAVLAKLGFVNESTHFIGGAFSAVADDAGNAILASNIARWDNSTGWSTVGGGVNGPVNAMVMYERIAPGPNIFYVYVGGSFDRGINPDGSVVLSDNLIRWNVNDAVWEPLGGLTGGANPVVQAMDNFDANGFSIYIGGSFTTATDPAGNVIPVSNFACFQIGIDEYTSPLGGVDGPVRAVEIGGYLGHDLVFLGGDFQNALGPNGSVPAPFATIWHRNDEIYYPVGQGFNAPVRSIAKMQKRGFGSSYAFGGDFTEAYDIAGTVVAADHIAKYTPEDGTFVDFGSGTDGRINAMFHAGFCHWSSGENLYVGGDFTRAGTRNARSIARWKHIVPSRYPTMVAVHSGVSSGGGGKAAVAIMPLFPCTSLARGTDTRTLFGDLSFGEGTFAERLAVDSAFTIEIAPADDPGNPIATIPDVMIDSEDPHAIVIYGLEDPTGYAPNPDGRSTQISAFVAPLIPGDGLLPTATGPPRGGAGCHLVFFNSVTDAPAVDVVIPGVGTVATGLGLGDGTGPVTLPSGSHTLEIRRTSDQLLLGTDSLDLTGMDDRVATIVIGGFVDPAANNNGPALGCWAFDVSGIDLTLDTDGDGLPDFEDACVTSVLGGSVVVNGCDSGVASLVLLDGCTLQDRIDACGSPSAPNPQYTLCVKRLANAWLASDDITSDERDDLVRCATSADASDANSARLDPIVGSGGAAPFGLRLASQNPTRSDLHLEFSLPRAENAALEVYDVRGRRVRRLAHGPHGVGTQRAVWDLRNGSGQRVSAGIYLVRLVSDSDEKTRKVVVLE